MQRFAPPCIAAVFVLTLAGCPDAPQGSLGDTAAADVDTADSHSTPDAAVADLGGPDKPKPAVIDDDKRFFDTERVYDVRITMDPDDWDTLRQQSRSLEDILGGADCLDGPVANPFTWFRADVAIDGLQVNEVAVRKKGFLGSLDGVRPSIKVKLDQYVEGQDLGGLTRLTLNNAKQDPSKINQCVTYSLYTAAGVPTPRCSYVHLYLNGEDMGVYVNVESIKKDFLRRHFDYEAGNLYEGALSDFRDGWMLTFAKKTNDEDPDRSDLDAVLAATEAPDVELLDRLAEVIELDSFYSMWAMDVLTNHTDGYARNTNNFYVYRDLDGRFTFIPWGADNTLFWDPNAGQPASVMAAGNISRRLYLHPDGQAAYLARLQGLLNSVWDEGAIVAEIDRQEALVTPHVLADQLTEMQARVQTKRDFVLTHRARIQAELSPTPVVWTEPLRNPPCFVQRGAIDISFETTWGTLQQENIFATGTAAVDATVDGVPWAMLQAGSKSGSEKPGEAQIVIAGQLDPQTTPGGVFVAVVVVPEPYIGSDVEIPINFSSSYGQVVRLAPGATEPESIGFMFGGTLILESGGTTPGSAVKGRILSPVVQIGGG